MILCRVGVKLYSNQILYDNHSVQLQSLDVSVVTDCILVDTSVYMLLFAVTIVFTVCVSVLVSVHRRHCIALLVTIRLNR